ncbi:DMT family transporter [Pseudolysinimonas sp.]|uniref:DMT family transporter n=1 Tax=Pseudolysinimonas sp. TaxID=2680009 RepID=UPI003F7D2B19
MHPSLDAFSALSLPGRLPIVGIAIALVGGLFLALGAQFQHRGVQRAEARHQERVHDAGDDLPTTAKGLGAILAGTLRLLKSPWWLLGTVLYAIAILCQLTSLGFAPITVVQPIGVVALVITSIVNSRMSRIELTRPTIRAIVLCVLGVGIFVGFAAANTDDPGIDQGQMIIVLSILVIVVFLLGLAYLLFRRQFRAIFYVIAAGVCFGFVATIAKVTINRFLAGDVDWLVILALLGILASGGLGAYFVQNAYSIGAPDLVIAGLTVVDPIVAVVIGLTVLGEGARTPVWVLFVWLVSAAIAIAGVIQLARHHPQTVR